MNPNIFTNLFALFLREVLRSPIPQTSNLLYVSLFELKEHLWLVWMGCLEPISSFIIRSHLICLDSPKFTVLRDLRRFLISWILQCANKSFANGLSLSQTRQWFSIFQSLTSIRLGDCVVDSTTKIKNSRRWFFHFDSCSYSKS